ncbi:transmembrane protein 145-like isoform X4 [Mytilus edulis]|uniref:transmembrane protein 145-like isoform X4 n=1 Tax=Mytilus edulis TaxID=6550 RepID=UPI0039EF0BD4
MEVKLLLLVLGIFQYNSITTGKRVEDYVVDSGDWKFITRFCFLARKGTLRYSFEYPVTHSTHSVLLYFDEDDQWPAVYKSGKTCEQKVATLNPANNQIIHMSVLYSWSGCSQITKNGQDVILCEGGRVFKSTRERWWFLAVSRCDQSSGGVGLNFTYNFHMTNGPEDDLLRHEYSADEFYILPIDISFLLAYVVLFVLSCICAYLLKQRQLFHTTYKMFMVALLFWLVGLMFASISYGMYGGSGYEQPQTKVVGRIFSTISEMIFLLMLVLMGKGYTITRGVLSTQSTIVISVFFSAYTVCYSAVFIYEAKVFDPGEVLYTYESPPGYGLISLRLIAWVWFCYSVFFTLKNYKSKSLFYYPFFIFYTIWFWASPAVILIAMFELELWTREKIVVGVQQFVALFGHVFFLILTRPQAANKNFPYHVRTTQIASLTGTEVDGFNSYNYNSGSICASPSGPDLSNLFVTSHSRSTDKLVAMGGDDANYEMKNSRSMSEFGIPSPSSPKYDNFRSRPSFMASGLPPLSPIVTTGDQFMNFPPSSTRRSSDLMDFPPPSPRRNSSLNSPPPDFEKMFHIG